MNNGTNVYAAVRTILEYVGEDPDRPGLVDTPKRVAAAWDEFTRGYIDDPQGILSVEFPKDYDYDELVGCCFIEFCSMCEHHLLPFTGYAHVGYIPRKGGGVVGLSKLARLVDCFARRLQVQEQLTAQVAGAMDEALKPRGVAVVVTAKHLCMSCRGVSKQRSQMVTSRMTGAFRKAAPRAEFFKLVELAQAGGGGQ
jgi:GTP cyclohydrolase I